MAVANASIATSRVVWSFRLRDGMMILLSNPESAG
jgi:hypothetical protein